MLVIKPNLIPRCALYVFSHVPIFKAIGLLYGSFLQKNEETYQDFILGMVKVIFFKFGF